MDYLKHLARGTLFEQQVLLVERLQGLSCNLGFLFGFTCSVIQQVHLDVGGCRQKVTEMGRVLKESSRWTSGRGDGRKRASWTQSGRALIETEALGASVTWEGFGAWFGGKASCPDHLHLQLAFLIHQPDLNITWWCEENKNTDKSH